MEPSSINLNKEKKEEEEVIDMEQNEENISNENERLSNKEYLSLILNEDSEKSEKESQKMETIVEKEKKNMYKIIYEEKKINLLKVNKKDNKKKSKGKNKSNNKNANKKEKNLLNREITIFKKETKKYENTPFNDVADIKNNKNINEIIKKDVPINNSKEIDVVKKEVKNGITIFQVNNYGEKAKKSKFKNKKITKKNFLGKKTCRIFYENNNKNVYKNVYKNVHKKYLKKNEIIINNNIKNNQELLLEDLSFIVNNNSKSYNKYCNEDKIINIKEFSKICSNQKRYNEVSNNILDYQTTIGNIGFNFSATIPSTNYISSNNI